MSRSLLAAVIASVLAAVLAPGIALAISTAGPVLPTATLSVSVSAPSSITPGTLAAVTVTLPSSVAAVDGRLLFKKGSAEVIGVAPVGHGTAFSPVAITGGASFGAYGLRPTKGHTVLRFVLDPKVAGRLQVRVIVDSAANSAGRRLGTSSSSGVVATMGVLGSSRVLSAPSSGARFLPTRAAGPTTESIRDGKFNKQDLDTVRGAWELARETGQVCGTGLSGDANGDGCVDIVDVQAVVAAQGTTTSTPAPAVTGGHTFTVTSSADTADATPGNGICADSQGRCTLRAAMTEADYLKGDDRIEFNLPGTAPVTIQLASPLPMITSRVGTVTIDGYTQPGAHVNTSTVGSNAVPGVEVRGSGTQSGSVTFRVDSPGNTIRGLIIDNAWRGIFLDGTGATGNKIVGNWIGFRPNGANASSNGQFGILVNTGATANFIGTPDLADRNIIGNWTTAIDNYGPGTDGNVIQDNQLCIGPSGFTTATCGTGIDHNFGPKNDLIGGTAPNACNIIGPTTLQGIEYSHGWNPALPYGTDTATTYQINNNHVIGNWVGFRGDGSYNAAYRSGLNFSSADNDQGVNVYDGSNNNVVEKNYIASVYDGVQVMAPDAKGNIVRNNIIGLSPLGEAAPLTGWGVKVRWGTTYDYVVGNQIHNAAKGGVGLVSTDNNGVAQAPAYNIEISQNIVTDTSGPAIYLAPLQGNPTKGANVLLASPVITSATTALVSGTAGKGATVEVYQASRNAGQYGLPAAYLGSTTVAANGTWSLPVSTLSAGDRVTSLQIRADLNTSELSANALVSQAATPPQPGDLLASDAFGRTISGGWGDADQGGTWGLTGTATDFSVGSGAGQVSVAAGLSREASLALAANGANVAGLVSVDRLPVGGNAFAYVDADLLGTSAYRATIRVAATGVVYVQLRDSLKGIEAAVAPEVNSGLHATPGTPIAFRFRVVGNHLQFRVWDPTGSEPSTWQTESDDSTAGIQAAGGVGLRSYTGKPATNGPVTFSLSAFEVRVP